MDGPASIKEITYVHSRELTIACVPLYSRSLLCSSRSQYSHLICPSSWFVIFNRFSTLRWRINENPLPRREDLQG